MKLQKVSSVLMVVSFLVPNVALTQSSIKQQGNKVACGNVVAQGNGVVTLTCNRGLSAKERQALENTIPDMLNQILNANAEQFAAYRAQMGELLAETHGGNLGERAVTLAQDMILDLVRRGWQPPGEQRLAMFGEPFMHFPMYDDSPEYHDMWWKGMRLHFNFRYTPRLIEIHDEFADLHIKDQILDNYLKFYQDVSKDPVVPLPADTSQIQMIAATLVEFSNRLNPSRAQPCLPGTLMVCGVKLP
jgi:hypothetical protein